MTLGDEVIYDNGWATPDLRALRRDRIGFVFQAPYLISFLDVTDNVALLPMLAGVPNAQARQRALELLTALDVAHRAKAAPAQPRRRTAARVHRPRTGQPPAGDPGRRTHRPAGQHASAGGGASSTRWRNRRKRPSSW